MPPGAPSPSSPQEDAPSGQEQVGDGAQAPEQVVWVWVSSLGSCVAAVLPSPCPSFLTGDSDR